MRHKAHSTPPAPGTSLLARLHSDLLERQVMAEFLPGVEKGEIDAVCIPTGEDVEGRPLVAQAFVMNDVLNAAGLPGDDDMIVLILQMALPLSVAPDAADEVAIALSLANKFSLIGTFLFEEADGMVILRYPMVTARRGFDCLLMLDLLLAMRLAFTTLQAPLELVTSGQFSAAEFERYIGEELNMQLPWDLVPKHLEEDQ